jgi:hypothetical protein
MLLTRNPHEAPAILYQGIQFRSKLETQVAQWFDEVGILWKYEQRLNLDLPYLPDFKVAAGPRLDRRIAEALPEFVEVKPQELIYELQRRMGLPDVFPEETTITSSVTATELQTRQIEEFWKPKRLAELLKCRVLVIGRVDGVRTLSPLMHPDGILWQRNHPIVNWRGVQQKHEREEKRAREQAEHAERLQAFRESQAREEAARRKFFEEAVNSGTQRRARFAGYCRNCRNYCTANQLTLFYGFERGPIILCDDCVEDHW